MGCTLGTCLFVGGGYMFCCMPLMMTGGGDGGEEIMLAPFIPFLLAFPGICSMDVGHMPTEVGVAFFFGMLGYAIAAGFLYVVTKETFDRRSGRTGVAWTPPTPPRGWTPPVTAELVAEPDGDG
jgi:hypothetical protein